jgi:hypothetical protein
MRLWARRYNFDKSFFEQIKELHFEVSRPNFAGTNIENSDFYKNAVDIKNSVSVGELIQIISTIKTKPNTNTRSNSVKISFKQPTARRGRR